MQYRLTSCCARAWRSNLDSGLRSAFSTCAEGYAKFEYKFWLRIGPISQQLGNRTPTFREADAIKALREYDAIRIWDAKPAISIFAELALQCARAEVWFPITLVARKIIRWTNLALRALR